MSAQASASKENKLLVESLINGKCSSSFHIHEAHHYQFYTDTMDFEIRGLIVTKTLCYGKGIYCLLK